MHFRAGVAAAIVAAGLSGVSQAADINERGANDLLGNLTHFFSDDLKQSGIVTVKPAGDRYEVSYDLSKLFEKLNLPDLVISGLKPVTAFATPKEGGLWNIEGDNAFDITGQSTKEPKTEFRYALASSNFSGVIDPALHYARSMDVKGNSITLATKTGDGGLQKNDLTIDSFGYTLASANGAEAGKLDIQMNGGLQSLHDKISADTDMVGDVRVGAVNFKASATSLPLQPLNDLFSFASGHKDTKTLSENDSAAFKAILLKMMPLFDSAEELVSAKDIAVTTPFGNGGLQSLDYSLTVDGPARATNVNFGLRLEKLTVDSLFVSSDYARFIPDVAEMKVGVPDLNLAALKDVLQQTDFSELQGPAGEATSDKIQKAMFPDGTMIIAFPKISATSSIYDIEASGTLKGWLKSDRASMQMSILARDLDKTIAAIQEAAKSEPKLSQVSFGLMMAKGFAKTDPDGRSRWDVTIADDKSVTVNGQVIK